MLTFNPSRLPKFYGAQPVLRDAGKSTPLNIILDTPGEAALEWTLTSFEGAGVMISHDRHFRDRVVARLLEVTQGVLVEHPGGLDYYLERTGIGA